MALTTPVETHTTLSAKNACALVHARICNGAEALRHDSYCELILSLAQASYRLLFVARSCCPSCCLDQTRHPMLFAQEICPNSRKLMTWSPLRCCSSIIRSYALMLIQFVCRSHSRLATELIHQRILFSLWFLRASTDNGNPGLNKNEQLEDVLLLRLGGS